METTCKIHERKIGILQIWSGLSGVVFFHFLLGTILIGHTRAQTCWRDTPCSNITVAAFPGVWDSNIFAPPSRTTSPKSILSTSNGRKISAYPSVANLAGNGSSLVFDFGIEVGGIVSIQYTVGSGGGGAVGLAFAEATNWIGELSDLSASWSREDGALHANFAGPGVYNYTMPLETLRGGFRYMTAFLISDDPSVNITITNVSIEISFQPTWSNLRAYRVFKKKSRYFHSDDEMLNAIWYSGVYTLQTCSLPVHTGRSYPVPHTGWANNGTLGPGYTIIVDGAKRGRDVWPGDIGIAMPSSFVSLGDMESQKNALQALYRVLLSIQMDYTTSV